MQDSVNVGDQSAVKSRKKRHKLLEERQIEELRQMIDTPGGRWLLWRILEKTGLFSSLSHSNPHEMAISSGARDVGLWLIGEINEADRNGYRRLMDEAKERDIDG
jgi:hypothetical protein